LMIARSQRKALQQNRKWDLEDRAERDKKQELVGAVVQLTASDILHHAKQPVMDILIDKFNLDPDLMTDQELTQYIQRLYVISHDRTQQTAQQPAARMMLDRTLMVAKKRELDVAITAEGGENRIAGEAMRAEAEPQRNLKIDVGEQHSPNDKVSTVQIDADQVNVTPK